jgi:hypothetical protein
VNAIGQFCTKVTRPSSFFFDARKQLTVQVYLFSLLSTRVTINLTVTPLRYNKSEVNEADERLTTEDVPSEVVRSRESRRAFGADDRGRAWGV